MKDTTNASRACTLGVEKGNSAVLKLFLDKCPNLAFTQQMFKFAAAFYDLGTLLVLLERGGSRVKITQDVAMCAASNEYHGDDVMKLQRGMSLQIHLDPLA